MGQNHADPYLCSLYRMPDFFKNNVSLSLIFVKYFTLGNCLRKLVFFSREEVISMLKIAFLMMILLEDYNNIWIRIRIRHPADFSMLKLYLIFPVPRWQTQWEERRDPTAATTWPRCAAQASRGGRAEAGDSNPTPSHLTSSRRTI
jgi:hypothetical protein